MKPREGKLDTFQSRALLVFLTFLAVSASLLGLVVYGLPLLVAKPIPLSTVEHGLGSSGLSFVGWSMPSNILISTSFVTDQQISGFISGVLNMFPYQVQPGTVLVLGLYVNGILVANQNYEVENSTHPAAPVGEAASQMANFTHSIASYSVALLGMKNPLPPGTTITMTAMTNNPIWVEIDDAMPYHSFQSGAFASQALPSQLAPETGVVAPHALSMGVEFNAP